MGSTPCVPKKPGEANLIWECGMTQAGKLLKRRTVLVGLTGASLLAAGGALSQVVIDMADMRPGEFTWWPERAPEGSVAIIVSIPEQRVHVFRNGVRIAVSTCSTGKPGHETPTGVFTILQKDKNHHSSTYNNASMPNMNRLTWDGVALHAGKLPGYPASHGCVRLPMEFSEKLFSITHVGTPVIIAGAHTDPWELTHPGVLLTSSQEGHFEDAVSVLDQKSHPSDWPEGEHYPVTTVIASSADRKIQLIQDGVSVVEAEIGIREMAILGEHVFLLQAAGDEYRWHGITHHPDPANPQRSEVAVAGRLVVPDHFNRVLIPLMHPGMTMIVTDMPLHPDMRSGEGFVIMTS